MSLPMIMLGGVPIALHAGAPSEQISPLGGPEIIRLRGGAGVPMTHWQKSAISISGSGWMPPGLHGLDYTQPLELRCTKPLSIVGAHRGFTLSGSIRPDVAPWAQALIGDDWVNAALEVSGQSAQVAEMVGASLYRVCWMPLFIVAAKRPQEDLDAGAATHGWRLDCEEL